tara:strand:+ start:120 stop:449 length:330 start_codon:yes stop_codon:yes gene_type:complete
MISKCCEAELIPFVKHGNDAYLCKACGKTAETMDEKDHPSWDATTMNLLKDHKNCIEELSERISDLEYAINEQRKKISDLEINIKYILHMLRHIDKTLNHKKGENNENG